MPVSGYIDTPFAESGDLTAVPDAVQVDGSVSYAQGWPILYSTPVGSGGYNIARGTMNQILNDITTAIQNWQQNTVAPFITSTMNGGSPYSYPAYALVLYSGVVYLSLVNANTDTPPTSKWQAVPLGIAPLASPALTGTPTAPTAAAGTNTTQLATTAFARETAFCYQAWVFISSGTFTTPADSTTSTVYQVTCYGGGGGGGGSNNVQAAAGGGGASGIAVSQLSGISPSTGIAVTIGAAGTGASAGGNGVGGGASSVASPVSIASGGGSGGGGATSAGAEGVGGTGGGVSGSTSILGFTGQGGGIGMVMAASGTLGIGGRGGSIGLVGEGGFGGATGSGNGIGANGYGSGGGGGVGATGTGGNGTPGYVKIERLTP